MMTSFYSGLSGLTGYASALNIVGNNLANINTVGFKGSSMTFEDLVTNTFGGLATNGAGNPMQIGLGVMTSAIDGVFSQGSIQTSTEATNVAIEGNGFFIVGDTDNYRYTRDGTFSFSSDGYLINSDGNYVMGYTQQDANGELISSGSLNRIWLPANTVSAPNVTSFVQVYANLNVNDADASTYTASVTIYDSKGASHVLSIEFAHQVPGTTANDDWNYTITLPGDDVTGGTAGTPFTLATGTLQFDGTGTLVTPAADVTFNTPTFTNGANAITGLNWDLFDENGVPSLTGYPLESATNSTNTDGYAPGNLSSIIIGGDGIIQGVFSNGQVEDLAQLAVATFNNNDGLLRMGKNLFLETNASGAAAIGAANSGGRGAITGSALEASNVDIATEFTSMLIFQRGYQSNSRVITTSDELVQEALSIKR
jgi:flagellar hook protein FlgE